MATHSNSILPSHSVHSTCPLVSETEKTSTTKGTEEVQVIRFLAEKHGTAFEAELYEKLNLPRTTTWRLLKRLEKMEIVDIRKSRRQNIVSIRKKYMKK